MSLNQMDEEMGVSESQDASTWSGLKPYISIARPDHWFKNVFVLPGVALGILISGEAGWLDLANIILCLISVCLVASANYTINEWLDAEFDRHHPVKKSRPSVGGHVKPGFVYLQYALLSVVGLWFAYLVSNSALYTMVFLLLMGLIYNVPPIRSKDRVYVDVLSESINNPIRFMLGWFAIVDTVLPPSSILLAYWMGGAFLMGAKRLSEYRFIDDPDRAGLYRRSFQFYDEQKLLLSVVFYALMSAFFFGVFLIKYRIELLLVSPALALLFAWYLQIALKPRSTAQAPEKLYKEKGFVLFLLFLCALIGVLLFVDIPWLDFLVEYTAIDWSPR